MNQLALFGEVPCHCDLTLCPGQIQEDWVLGDPIVPPPDKWTNNECQICGETVRAHEPRYKFPYPPGHGTDRNGNGKGLWVCINCKVAARIQIGDRFFGDYKRFLDTYSDPATPGPPF